MNVKDLSNIIKLKGEVRDLLDNSAGPSVFLLGLIIELSKSLGL